MSIHTYYLMIRPNLSTLRLLNLRIRRLHSPQLLRQPIGQLIHSLQSQVEPSTRHIYRKHINRLIGVSGLVADLIAFSTVGAIPALHGRCTPDQRESGEGFEIRVAFGDEAVDAVGAGDGGKRAAALVVLWVIGDGGSLGSGWGWDCWCGW